MKEVKKVAEFIEDEIDNYLIEKRQKYPAYTNWASQLGHPCIRYLVHARLDWEEKEYPSLRLMKIFEDGHIHEDAVKSLLRKAGIRIVRGQEPFKWRRYQVSGRIDGVVKYDNKHYPIEIKGLSHAFDEIDSIENMLEHSKYYIRGYPIQLMTYMMQAEAETGLFILKSKLYSDFKIIPCELDYDLMEEILQKVEKVNEYVEKEEYPERIPYDPTICDDCDFEAVCMPEKKVEDGAVILESDDFQNMLERKEELKEYKKEYNKLDRRIKQILNSQEHKKIFAGNYYIEGKEVNRDGYTVKPSSYMQWKFKKIKKETE